MMLMETLIYLPAQEHYLNPHAYIVIIFEEIILYYIIKLYLVFLSAL